MSKFSVLAAMSAAALMGNTDMGSYVINLEDGYRHKSHTDEDLEDAIPPMPNLSKGRPSSNWDGVIPESLTRQQKRFLARKQMPK